MNSDVDALEPKLKEILYRCLEDIKARKAALYLMDDKEERYQVVTEYGFRDAAKKGTVAREEVVDRLITRRTPFFINSLTEEPRFSELLFAADTTRMLVAPIFSRGRLVGFIDMRDKSEKAPFGAADLAGSQRIVDLFIEFFAQKGLFGQKPMTLSNVKNPVFEQLREPSSVDLAAGSAAAAFPPIVDEARRAISRGVMRTRSAPDTLTDLEVNAGAKILPSVLSLQGVAMAALSSFGRFGGTQVIAAKSEITDAALQQFQAKLSGWLQKRGEAEGPTKTAVVYPMGKVGVPVEPSRLASMLSAPVQIPSLNGVVLTVAFENAPNPQTRGLLNDFLRETQDLVEFAISHETLQAKNQRIAEKLLEPDFQKYQTLAEHCKRVSDLAERLAQFVGLSAVEAEAIRIAGLVHDVGLRMLNYSTLYRKPTPTADELKLMREHPVVGAAIVAESALGPEIATLVYSHHERPDGTGYPDGTSGEAIPVGSRIIHICEAYDAMISPDTYQTAVPIPSALAKIKRAAGAQFDETLAARFVEMMSP